jgi:anaerobic magnesium-protoporphyrin IX monomethyl ester cyclase
MVCEQSRSLFYSTKKNMNIILTHAYFINEDPKEQAIMKPYVPLGILSISAYLEQHQIEHQVIDTTFINYTDFIKELNDKKPDIIGIYTNLMTKLNVLKIVKHIKQTPALSHTKIILGGPEVRNHADNFLCFGADILVIGEGEETFLEIVNRFKSTNNIADNIPGTAVIKNGTKVTNPERTLIKDINTLPIPNRKKINLQLYLDAWKKRHGYSTVSVSTMRGCPYTCKWCSRAVYGVSYRRKKPSLVVNEIEYIIKNYNPDRIWFVDDVFTISHKWLKEFAEEIQKRNVKINYEIISRADRMNEQVIDLLRQSGCYKVWIGAESGSQKIIDAMDRRVDVNKVREMIKLAQRKGIKAGTFIMLGYPGETIADIKETIFHLIDSNPDEYTVTIAYPITGTPLYNEVKNKITTHLNWAESTDRDIDFKRQHSKKFYEYAVRWVYNSVWAAKDKNFINKMKYNIKGLISRVLMQLYV